MKHQRGTGAAARLAGAILMFLLPAGRGRFTGAADVDWSARLTFSERYDDNITELSSRDLDRLSTEGGGSGFACGSSSTATSGGRFSIQTPDDYVSIPQLSTVLRAGWLRGRPTAFDFDVAVYQYARNPIKNWQSYRLSVEQPLHAGKYATEIGLSYYLVPGYYLRNLRSDRTADELGVLPPPRREASYRRHGSFVRLNQDLVPRYLHLQATLGKEGRNYNRCFDERDSEMPFGEIELGWQPLGDQRLRIRATFRREDLHAGGNLPQTMFFTEEDISNRRDIRGLDGRFRWGRKGRRRTISAGYEKERRNYSTGNVNDVFHFDREDVRTFMTLGLRVELASGWFLAAFGQHESNRARFPFPTGTTVPEEATSFDENLYQIGFGYDFGIAGGQGSGTTAGRPVD